VELVGIVEIHDELNRIGQELADLAELQVPPPYPSDPWYLMTTHYLTSVPLNYPSSNL
jgi:hypothetical protein